MDHGPFTISFKDNPEKGSRRLNLYNVTAATMRKSIDDSVLKLFIDGDLLKLLDLRCAGVMCPTLVNQAADLRLRQIKVLKEKSTGQERPAGLATVKGKSMTQPLYSIYDLNEILPGAEQAHISIVDAFTVQKRPIVSLQTDRKPLGFLDYL